MHHQRPAASVPGKEGLLQVLLLHSAIGAVGAAVGPLPVPGSWLPVASTGGLLRSGDQGTRMLLKAEPRSGSLNCLGCVGVQSPDMVKSCKIQQVNDQCMLLYATLF